MAGLLVAPTRPAELIAQIISYLQDPEDLTSCCYVAKDFVQPSQRALFAELSLPSTPVQTIRLSSLLQDAPHIRRFIKTLSLSAGFPMYARHLKLLLSMPLPRLRTLVLREGSFGGPVFDVLNELLLPQIHTLHLVNASVPLRTIDHCPKLKGLYYRDITDFELTTSSNQLLAGSTFPLELLSFGQWVDPLLANLNLQRFPSLAGIRLPWAGKHMKGRAPLPWIGGVLRQIGPNLTFLDLDIWDVDNMALGLTRSLSLAEINLAQMTTSHPFFIGLYPRLQCLRLAFHESHELPGMEETLRLEWFAKLFELVKDPLPLQMVIFAPSTLCSIQTSPPLPCSGKTPNLTSWELVDRALSSPQFNRLEEVIVPLGGGRLEVKDRFRKELAQLNANERLSFREVDFGQLFYAAQTV